MRGRSMPSFRGAAVAASPDCGGDGRMVRSGAWTRTLGVQPGRRRVPEREPALDRGAQGHFVVAVAHYHAICHDDGCPCAASARLS